MSAGLIVRTMPASCRRGHYKKYRESIAGQKFGELSEVEKEELIAAFTNEQWRIVSRGLPWFFIIMFLITGLE